MSALLIVAFLVAISFILVFSIRSRIKKDDEKFNEQLAKNREEMFNFQTAKQPKHYTTGGKPFNPNTRGRENPEYRAATPPVDSTVDLGFLAASMAYHSSPSHSSCDCHSSHSDSSHSHSDCGSSSFDSGGSCGCD